VIGDLILPGWGAALEKRSNEEVAEYFGVFLRNHGFTGISWVDMNGVTIRRVSVVPTTGESYDHRVPGEGDEDAARLV